MRKILLCGCNGRMGRVISQLCETHPDVQIAAGIDCNAVKLSNYPVYADPVEFSGYADVAVDFSSTAMLDNLLPYLLHKQIPIVLATTGYSPEQLAAIEEASKNLPIFRSANMSLGINLLYELVKKASAVLGADFNIEIVERHHKTKVDSPSGTALLLLEACADALPYKPYPVYDRHSVRQKRAANEIGLHSIRGGTIVGDHDVIFAGHDEVITLSHSASSREVFAAGAIRAAIFMSQQRSPGLYTMKDLLA